MSEVGCGCLQKEIANVPRSYYVLTHNCQDFTETIFPICLFSVFWGACSTDTVSAEENAPISSSFENSPSGISSAGNAFSSSAENLSEDSCLGTPGIPWDGTTAKSFAVGAGDNDYNGKYFRLEVDILLNEGDVIDSGDKNDGYPALSFE